LEEGTHRTKKTRGTQRSLVVELRPLHEASGAATSTLMNREVEVGSRVNSVDAASAYRTDGKSLIVLQVNCWSIYNKASDFWNLVDIYNPDVVIGTQS
jgi:hypothetical protein